MTRAKAQVGTYATPGNLHVPEDCRAVSEVLARVGDKWTVLVVTTLGDGPSVSTNCVRRWAPSRSAC